MRALRLGRLRTRLLRVSRTDVMSRLCRLTLDLRGIPRDKIGHAPETQRTEIDWRRKAVFLHTAFNPHRAAIAVALADLIGFQIGFVLGSHSSGTPNWSCTLPCRCYGLWSRAEGEAASREALRGSVATYRVEPASHSRGRLELRRCTGTRRAGRENWRSHTPVRCCLSTRLAGSR